MKENAKLVLPKIAPFNEEDENDVSATLKEDEESKTRSQRKRVGWLRSVRYTRARTTNCMYMYEHAYHSVSVPIYTGASASD